MIYAAGGSQKITGWWFEDYQIKKPTAMYITDSRGFGYGTNQIPVSYYQGNTIRSQLVQDQNKIMIQSGEGEQISVGLIKDTMAYINDSAKYWIINAGSNDIRSSVSLAVLDTAYSKLYRCAERHNAIPICFTLPPEKPYLTSIQSFNTWLKGYAANYVDVYPLLLGTDGNVKTQYTISDLIHVNGTATQIQADLFNSLYGYIWK